MTKHQDSELQAEEREREALAHIRKEQALRTGTIFDSMLLTYLEDGDSPEFRDNLRRITIEYLKEVDGHPHVIKAAVPSWVVRLLVTPIPPPPPLIIEGVSAEDVVANLRQMAFNDAKAKNIDGVSSWQAFVDRTIQSIDDAEKKDAE